MYIQPTTTEQRPTLDVLGSDHPRFRAGMRIAATVEDGQLARLSFYGVLSITIDRPAGRVTIVTGQEYTFVVTALSYDALLAMPQALAVPAWWYTDRVRRPHYYGRMWRGRVGSFE